MRSSPISSPHIRELPRTLVVFALRAEGAGLFEDAGIPVLYCGVGKVNAAMALTRELTRYALTGEPMPMVVNFGSAGSRIFATGSIVACRQFVQRDMDVSGLGFAIGITPFDDSPSTLSFETVFDDLPSAICGSGDSFATGDIAIDCSVVDMESYALAKVCWCEHAQFACVKYVTDGADDTAADQWKLNVHKAAESFLRLYRNLEK